MKFSLSPNPSQNTMYCGGEPEQRHNTHILIAHKHVFTKYMHMSGMEPSSLAVGLFTNHRC